MSCSDKNCKCGEKTEANLAKPVECTNFYLGVDDVTMFRGKKDDMKQVGDSVRFFTEKFHKDPKRAAELVFFNQLVLYTEKDRSFAYDPKFKEDFWKKVHYDAKQKTYIYEEYLTIGTRLPPKPCQMEHFYRGEYEFIKLRHEIQVLKTELVKV